VESRDDEAEESAFGTAKPMLPYSSMFVLGSTNPSVYTLHVTLKLKHARNILNTADTVRPNKHVKIKHTYTLI